MLLVTVRREASISRDLRFSPWRDHNIPILKMFLG